MCLYHRLQMPLDVLNGALATHPITGVHGEYCANPFYEPDVTMLLDIEEQLVLEKLRRLERRH